MKVFVLVRTLNEASNIRKFCHSYSWADKILVADGGSEDATKELANKFSNVEVRDFDERMYLESGIWRNPQGRHINFLIEWAEDDNADWIVFVDCDEFANYKVQQDIIKFMMTTENNVIRITKLFIWKRTKWMKKLSMTGMKGGFGVGLFAWRPTKIPFRFFDTPNAGFEYYPNLDDVDCLDLLPPYCILHHAWPDEATLQRKLNFYRLSGEIPHMRHPFDPKFGGMAYELPEYAR